VRYKSPDDAPKDERYDIARAKFEQLTKKYLSLRLYDFIQATRILFCSAGIVPEEN